MNSRETRTQITVFNALDPDLFDFGSFWRIWMLAHRLDVSKWPSFTCQWYFNRQYHATTSDLVLEPGDTEFTYLLLDETTWIWSHLLCCWVGTFAFFQCLTGWKSTCWPQFHPEMHWNLSQNALRMSFSLLRQGTPEISASEVTIKYVWWHLVLLRCFRSELIIRFCASSWNLRSTNNIS